MIWYILGGLALLICIAAFTPVYVELWYNDGEAKAQARYLFIKKPLYPLPEKPEQKPKPEPQQAEKPKREKKTDIFGILETVMEMLPAAGEAAGHILRRITLKRCTLRMAVARGDAAETAIASGRTNAAVYTAYSFAANIIRIRHFDAKITPDYDAEADRLSVGMLFCMRPATALRGGLKFLRQGGLALLNTTKKDG